MWLNLKIKTFWPLSMFFKGREYDTDTKEILNRKFDGEELTGSEKMLSDELKRQELISKIMGDKTDTSRSNRG